eukprot:TRINITY_DN9446_c0_g1_i1.p1 TRINITY_DN9446_c0_g1~~TRINITY_DN9446_c0_g1_i1.p1  ORF type:complete len:662 (+),score=151.67 TRINITY_DN9446_c0_g1_i1:3-1988(+)
MPGPVPEQGSPNIKFYFFIYLFLGCVVVCDTMDSPMVIANSRGVLTTRVARSSSSSSSPALLVGAVAGKTLPFPTATVLVVPSSTSVTPAVIPTTTPTTTTPVKLSAAQALAEAKSTYIANRANKKRGPKKKKAPTPPPEPVEIVPERKSVFFYERHTVRFTSPTITSNLHSELKALLAKQWHDRQEAVTRSEGEADDVAMDESGGNGANATAAEEEIDTVRKESVFDAELTEREQDIIRKRVALQQKRYEEFRNRKTSKVRAVHPYNTSTEISYALRECEEDENEAIAKLTEPRFLQHIRKIIAFEATGAEPPKKPLRSNGAHEDDFDSDADEEARKKRKRSAGRKRGGRRSTAAASLSPPVPGAGGDEDASGGVGDGGGDGSGGSEDDGDRARKRRRVAKLKLDDALAAQENTGEFEGWSAARIRAFKLIKTNPNAYYYRFNDPGVTQKNGPWAKEEKELFFKRRDEIGVNGQWGIFSMVIPGRVGYQCSNFYRHLVETGKVIDENYVIDAKGKAHFKFKRGFKVHRKKTEGEEESPAPATTAAKGGKKKRKARGGGEAGSDDDTEYRPPPSRSRRDAVEEEPKKSENPLPGFVDPITLEEVEQPAISPSGHVMSYSSWSRCLMGTNICPLTKQPLKKRDLVILTWDNIAQYKDMITNA